MSGFRTVLKRVRVGVEPNGSAAIDLSGTIANLKDIRFTTATATPAEETLPDESAVQSLHQRRQVKRGLRSGTVEISGILVPPAAEFNSSFTPAVGDALSSTLRVALGMTSATTIKAGDAVAVSPAPSSTTFTVTSGTSFAPNTWIAVETTSTSERFEPVLIKSVSTNAITLCWALSFTPVSTAKVLNSDSFYLTQGLPSATESHQFLVEGEGRDHSIYNYLGCQGPLSIDWTNGQFPTWSLTASAMTWLQDDAIATPQGGAALAVATLPGGSPVPITTGAVIVSPIAGTLRTLPIVAECKWALGSAWQVEPSYNGVQGKAQQVMIRGEQATCSLLVRAEDQTWETAWEAGTKYRVAAYAGNTGAGMLALAFTTCELIARPVVESPNGIDYWRLTFGALMNEDATPQTTDAAKAPWVLGRM